MQIAVLGAGGFVGSHLVEHLLSRGEHSVVGLDVSDEKLAGIYGSNFTFYAADIQHSSHLLDEVVGAADIVVDLVAYANPSMYVTSPIEVFELNFVQNLRIAELCMKHGKRLIQYSSAEVYGKANEGNYGLQSKEPALQAAAFAACRDAMAFFTLEFQKEPTVRGWLRTLTEVRT